MSGAPRSVFKRSEAQEPKPDAHDWDPVVAVGLNHETAEIEVTYFESARRISPARFGTILADMAISMAEAMECELDEILHSFAEELVQMPSDGDEGEDLQ